MGIQREVAATDRAGRSARPGQAGRGVGPMMHVVTSCPEVTALSERSGSGRPARVWCVRIVDCNLLGESG